ncbi:MAG: bifunctional phosphopantothenoylcysteine decarboxylase/phosphopantothenate--cysteine ligase CoaBC [Pseudomonadota bacterium]|nr:bifunctional phosphopantothenoylcysteine decarboxylase/phosphopantothenate--cysteine ligase CoaBC [Pseudomonadota bacterium]
MTQISWFQNKHIVLGVTGGIACYKACELARELGRRGAIVQVVMTKAATAFVSALTFQALTGRDVKVSMLDPKAEAGMGHIELARWADLILVAPCTANTMALLAQGQAPDLLSTIWTAAACEKAIAPAMNQQMWKHPETQANLERLSGKAQIIGPDSGIQACGDLGSGRMSEALEIADTLEATLNRGPLAGRRVVITAGPTHEPVDPVRYLGNRSSGKMGFALAEIANRLGAAVTLITGPVHLETPAGVNRIDVETASDMYAAVHSALNEVDLFIGAAAVCDMRPASVSEQKLKKSKDDLSQIILTENIDIIHSVATSSNRPYLVIGFAAETELVLEHARQKLITKSLDAIIANCVGDGEIFGQDETEATIVFSDSDQKLLLGTKSEVSLEIFSTLSQLLTKRI